MSNSRPYCQSHKVEVGEAVIGLSETALSDLTDSLQNLAFLSNKNTQSREKAMTDVELLHRLLSLVTNGSVERYASQIIKEYGSFGRVLVASVPELLATPGLNKHSVMILKLVYAFILRSARAAFIGRPAAEVWDHLLAYLRLAMSRERVEQFRLLFLDRNGKLMASEAQVRGTVNHIPVYPREVARRALEVAAASVVLVHNHPSGDPTPSCDDVEMTHAIRTATRVVGVEVYDHVIVVAGPCFSFREAGLLDPVPKPDSYQVIRQGVSTVSS